MGAWWDGCWIACVGVVVGGFAINSVVIVFVVRILFIYLFCLFFVLWRIVCLLFLFC